MSAPPATGVDYACLCNALEFVVALTVGASCLALAQDGVFIVLDDEASIRGFASVLGSGDGTASVDTNDPYPHDRDGEAALRIDSPAGDMQKFNSHNPGWAFGIVGRPQAEDEFRYITFAWRTEGAAGIMLQFSAQPGGWGHRYHAHTNLKGWNPSIQVTVDEPSTWQVHTRDLAGDWGGMIVNGMALTPGSGDYALFDHLAFHQSPEAVCPGRGRDGARNRGPTGRQVSNGMGADQTRHPLIGRGPQAPNPTTTE